MSRPWGLRTKLPVTGLISLGMAALAVGCGVEREDDPTRGPTVEITTDDPIPSVIPVVAAAPPSQLFDVPAATEKIDPEVAAAVARGESPKVLVLLDEGESQQARVVGGSFLDFATTAGTEHVARTLDLQKGRLWSRVPMAHVTTLMTYRHLPAVFLRVHAPDALAALAAAPEVSRIVPDRTYELMVDANLGLINQPTAAAAGKLGAGTAVAVLDTGTDYTQSAFGCTSPGVPAACKVAYAADFAANDNARDDNGHGTNVAGVVLAVAPATKILALDVFANGSGAASDILSAINWTIANRATYNIVAINMSLGQGAFTSACTTDIFAPALASARSAGIAPVVASGNAAKTSAISSPACVPAAISVGAVYAAARGGLATSVCTDASGVADKVACFSNSASFLTLLAPGVDITAAGITMSGTSQAAPHVAGAVAVLRSAFPGESVDATVARMTSTGVAVKDARNNLTKPRLDLGAALASAVTSAPTAPVSTPGPVGTIKLNAGAAFTRTASVTVALTVTSGKATQMCVSNTSACTAWATAVATKTWTLAAGDGEKTVYVSWKDAAGHVSAAPATATIKLDATAPIGGTMSGTVNGTTLALSWSGFSDALSGLASYKLIGGTTSPPVGCATGTVVYAGTGTTASATMTKGKTNYYRLCAVDAAGNVTAGLLATVKGI